MQPSSDIPAPARESDYESDFDESGGVQIANDAITVNCFVRHDLYSANF